MNDTPRQTIVVLEMRPNSSRVTDGGFIRICKSGYGTEIQRAEEQLNFAIAESEAGRRDLVPLHRLRAVRAYSKAISSEPIDFFLALAYKKAGKEMILPGGGFFEISLEDGIRAIEDAIADYPKVLASKRKRRAAAEEARELLNEKKERLEAMIRDVVYATTPQPEELRKALRGAGGKRLKAWTEKQLAMVKKEKRSAEAKEARDRLNAKKRALTLAIERVLHYNEPHPEELRDALDGLDGKRMQTWAEKELARVQKAKEASDKQRYNERQRPRELVVKYAKDVELDIASLRQIQRRIAALDDDLYVLTESEEDERIDLELDVQEICGVVQDWCYSLPKDLRDFAEIVSEVVENDCPLAGSFEDLVRHILIENWDEYGDDED